MGQLMDNMGPGEHSLPLSNVKRLFRAQFQVELSETALGYAKLSECLQDPRVRGLCDVKLQGQGYVMVPARKPVQRSFISLAESLCLESERAPLLQETAKSDSAGKSSLLHRRGGSVEQLSMDAIQSTSAS